MAKRKLSAYTTEELRSELDRREGELASRRDELLAQLRDIDKQLGTSTTSTAGATVAGGGGFGAGPRRGRGRPPGSRNKPRMIGRGPGRPPGRKKLTRRGPGRPPGTTGMIRRGPGRPPKTEGAAGTTRAPRGAGGGRRPQNSMTLIEAMRSVLDGRTLGVSEIARAVQDAGYKTSSANFRTIVNQTLIKNPQQFKKVDRGQYTAA